MWCRTLCDFSAFLTLLHTCVVYFNERPRGLDTYRSTDNRITYTVLKYFYSYAQHNPVRVNWVGRDVGCAGEILLSDDRSPKVGVRSSALLPLTWHVDDFDFQCSPVADFRENKYILPLHRPRYFPRYRRDAGSQRLVSSRFFSAPTEFPKKQKRKKNDK